MNQSEKNKLIDVDPLMMDILLEHYRHPHNFGELSPCDIEHEEGNPSCGDQIKMFMKINGGKIDDIKNNQNGMMLEDTAVKQINAAKIFPLDLKEGEALSLEELHDMQGQSVGSTSPAPTTDTVL